MQKEKLKVLVYSYCDMFAAILGTLAFLVAFSLNVWHCTTSAFIMVLCGVFLYVLFSKINNDIFNNKAIFSGVWFCSIGLAQLRLNVNQIPWENKTWFCLFVAYVSFLLGYSVLKKNKKNPPVKTKLKESTFFWIIIANFAVSILSFIFEAVNLGFIPAFTSDQASYVGFYVKGVHYFTVSIVLFVPLSILYLKNFLNVISKLKIAFISVCSLIAFAIPVLIVSRQLGLLQAVLCLFAVYYISGSLNKIKVFAMILVVAIGVSNWLIISSLRNQDNEYLREVFDAPPVTQEIYEEEMPEPIETKPDAEYSSNVSKWPMFIYHPYMYISFNFDNFNYSVTQINSYAKGIYSLHPIVHMSPLVRLYNKYPMYIYNKIYNTYPVVYTPYYDFGIVGIFIYMFLIGLLASFSATWNKEDPFLQIISYLIKFALMFSFFASFFANTAFLFYIVVLFIMSFVSNQLNHIETT